MLLLKLFLVPSLIAALTMIGRRWGPAIAGWLSGFPVVAGPVLLLIALEQGAPFAAAAAGGALTALPANVLFCLGYSWTASRFPWWVCLMGGLVCYTAGMLVMTTLALPNVAVFAITLVMFWIALQIFPRNLPMRPVQKLSPIELPFRMVASAILVLLLTYSASHLGPRVSGLFSTFPMLGSVLAAFSQPSSGPGAAVGLLRGMVGGFYSLSTFCFTLSLAIAAWGTVKGFLAAIACAMTVQLISLWLRTSNFARRKPVPVEAAPAGLARVKE